MNTPPCFDEQTYALWLLTPVKDKHTDVCQDCTQEYKDKMCQAGRCINPVACGEFINRKAS